MLRALLSVLVLALLPATASAQQVVTSAGPEAVAVTIYRDTGRDAGRDMRLERLGGYALITETRTVDLPAGKATVRFEGVAGGMLPESVLVTGLPKGVREKNLDADLLTPRSLYAHSLGRPVTLRRTNRETGEVIEEPAVIRSGLDGSVIVQTDGGYEAANCGPLSDALSYDGVPEGLSARPTLSIETQADAPRRVTLSLSYLAWGFDWKASYVVQMRPDGRKADVLAWVTLANSDPTSFADASTAVVGGTVNREDKQAYRGWTRREDLVFHCFFRPVAVDSMVASPMMDLGASADIVVTSMRAQEKSGFAAPAAVTVVEEELGDLKLYRVPMPTTVASKAQKQVALFQKGDVKVRAVYTGDIREGASQVVQRLRMQNSKRDGLGISLPAGSVTVFEPHSGQPVLSGEGMLRDAAVNQKVDVELGAATQVSLRVEDIGGDEDKASERHWRIFEAAVSNANPWPISFEGKLALHYREDETITRLSGGNLQPVDGRPTWLVTVPAGAIRTLRYKVAYQ